MSVKPSPATPPIELRIPASSEWVRVARLAVAGVASRLQFGIDDIEDIKLAVAEAINNAIQHAPVPDKSSTLASVTLTLTIEKEGLRISVTDEGRIAEEIPTHNSTPRHGDDDLPEGGLGLLLIRSLMDEVSHVSGAHSDTTVHMFKRLPRLRVESKVAAAGDSSPAA
jgi:serine/threonine-protein kinase RsbW